MAPAQPARLLVVRHGPGRGRRGPFLELALDHVARADPQLHRRIAVHETGTPAPSLDGVGAVFFWLGDPLKELYPQCHREAAAIAADAAARGIAVANPPDALSNSVKSVQARLLAEAGIATPRHAVFETREALIAHLDEIACPVLIKSDRMHSQKGMRICRTADALRAAAMAPRLTYPVSVAQFIDTRAGHDPRSLEGRLYHKKRTLVLGDIVHPRHMIFSAQPIVSLKTSTLAPFRTFAALRHALPLMPAARRSIEADNRFFFEGDGHEPLMRRVCEALGVSTAAIDYSVDAEGNPVIWEANPYFFLFSTGKYILPAERRHTARSDRLFEDATRFLTALAHPAGRE
ncbi:hypothetical protein [Oricola sp.]|uniref:hypothetical protein n=1 Tax=Oricola sp. TaxID=1979950 RepID=UPI0025EE9AAB|nr:hypothetical protein [Oricola sp.]MCI5074919.1 hypothetical protein [Oricola sp.]